jgi:hypothetical protein
MPRLRRRILPRSDGRRKVSSAEASLFQKNANRYNVAEPQPFLLAFFSILAVNILWLCPRGPAPA